MEWEIEEYPPFCYGPIYIMTPEIANNLFNLFKQTLKKNYIWIEDVYLTGKNHDINVKRKVCDTVNMFLMPKIF